MPITSSAKKALRQAKRRTAVNQLIKSRTKTAMDAFKKNLSAETLSMAFSRIDRAAKRGIMHRNKAARLKSQLANKAKSK